jgi:Putative zinc-finger
VTDEALTCEAVAERGLVERYVSGRLNGAALAELEAHLLTCSACREEVRIGMIVRAEMTAPVARARPRALRRRTSWVALGLAAAAALVLVVARPTAHDESLRPAFRGRDEGTPVIGGVSPAADALVSPASLTFVWRSTGPSAQYRLTVTNERGDVVWAHVASDTVRRLPAHVRLHSGQSYFWYVDALLPDGGSATSRAQRFTMAP